VKIDGVLQRFASSDRGAAQFSFPKELAVKSYIGKRSLLKNIDP
jgi:hypothetical protein